MYCQSRSSLYGSYSEVREHILKLAHSYNVGDKITVFDQREIEALRVSDIITNSNFVRPIDKALIDCLKPTAVIPLMWETWEYRSSDFDLYECKNKGILTLGTIEHKDPINMSKYTGLLGLSLLFDLGFECGDVLLLGSPDGFVCPIIDFMERIDTKVTWCGPSENADFGYEELREHFLKFGERYAYIILAEHAVRSEILGDKGYLSFENILSVNSYIKCGIIAGGVDENSLRKSALTYHPRNLASPGHMSYQPYVLGNQPVIKLFAGGLKVGEAMARARLSGFGIIESVKMALDTSPAMDFNGDNAWL